MSPRVAVLLGLLAGVATAALVLGAILALTPGPVHPTPTPVASPSPAEASPPPVIGSPSVGPSDGASPSGSALPSPAPSGSGPAVPSPSGSAFQAARPVQFWIDASGIVRAGALGGIGPDLTASSLRKILPGTTVTP